MKHHILAICILLVFSFWAIRPFLSSGFFPMHDDTQIARVIVMGKALRQGQFPVRWVSDLGYGYGYPIFNFYGPLPYYIGGFLYALGVDAIVATKLMFLLGIVLAPMTMYIIGASVIGVPGAILAAILYLYAPYHAVQIYVRGAVDEFWVLGFLPILFFGMWLVSKGKKYAPVIGGLGLSGVILSHTILGYVITLFVGFFIVLYWLWSTVRKRFDRSQMLLYVFLLLTGLGLSAFFWLPAIAEMRFTSVSEQIGSTANFRDHFVCISQLWESLWGYGGSISGCIDGLSFKIGKVHILLSLFLLPVWLIRRKNIRVNWVIYASGIILFLSLFFMLFQSEKVWEILPFFSYIQYPWRFLTFVIFSVSFLAGAFLSFSGRFQWLLLFTSIPLIIFVNGKLFIPQYSYPVISGTFESKEYLRFHASKISDEYLPRDISRPRAAVETPAAIMPSLSQLHVDVELDTDIYSRFIITTNRDKIIQLRKAYFPGWEYRVNGKRAQYTVVNGLPEIFIPAGTNVVELVFRNTPIRTVANAVSIVTVAALLFVYGKKTIT